MTKAKKSSSTQPSTARKPRLPLPPSPGGPQSTPKGKKGYTRPRIKEEQRRDDIDDAQTEPHDD